MSQLLAIISKGDRLSYQVSFAISELLKACIDNDGRWQGPIEPAQQADGTLRDRSVFPTEWLLRVERAALTGAFEHYKPDEIAKRILTTEPPADLAAAINEESAT